MMEFNDTPIETLEKHHAIAKQQGLRYAYIGNVPGHPLEHTYCPGCNNVAVERYGFSIISSNIDTKNRCKKCGYQISIIGKLNKVRKNYFQIFDA
jgi:pyruvate formate lyase activating enzyme